MSFNSDKNRFSLAAGFTIAQLEQLTPDEQDELDTLSFRRYGPDQVTYGDKQEDEWKAFIARIGEPK